MAKTKTQTKTKAQSKAVSSKPTARKLDKDGNVKQPSPWSVFLKENLKQHKDAHPGMSHKDAMKELGVLWDKAPENPNQGKPKKAVKPRVTKTKDAGASDPDWERPQVEPGSDE